MPSKQVTITVDDGDLDRVLDFAARAVAGAGGKPPVAVSADRIRAAIPEGEAEQ